MLRRTRIGIFDWRRPRPKRWRQGGRFASPSGPPGRATFWNPERTQAFDPVISLPASPRPYEPAWAAIAKASPLSAAKSKPPWPKNGTGEGTQLQALHSLRRARRGRRPCSHSDLAARLHPAFGLRRNPRRYPSSCRVRAAAALDAIADVGRPSDRGARCAGRFRACRLGIRHPALGRVFRRLGARPHRHRQAAAAASPEPIRTVSAVPAQQRKHFRDRRFRNVRLNDHRSNRGRDRHPDQRRIPRGPSRCLSRRARPALFASLPGLGERELSKTSALRSAIGCSANSCRW